MKIKFILFSLLFISTVNSYANRDTTLNVDLNSDGYKDNIMLSFSDTSFIFILAVNDVSISKKIDDIYEVALEIIDLDRYDGRKEIAINCFGPNDYGETYIYLYDEASLKEIGYIPLHIGFEVKGKNKIATRNWMGFWAMEQEYRYNPDNKTFSAVEKEFYPVNERGEVTEQLNLLEERSDNSTVSVKLLPGTKITIIKADVSPKCKYDDGTSDDYSCDWYYFTTPNGEHGWCRLRDFQSKVKGLNWAG